ncbi:MAG TPA: sensor histidine kinase [Ktedonobacterales bacterium]
MRIAQSLRVKLSILYLLTIVVPLVIIVFAMPGYYEHTITQNSRTLTAATLDSLSHNIDLYLDDLDNLTLAPYFNDEVMSALKLKASPGYVIASASQQLATNQALSITLPNILSNTRNDILSTIVLPYDGSVFVAGRYNPWTPVAGYPFQQQEWYKAAVAADGAAVFINPHPQNYLSTPFSIPVFSIARLIKDPDTNQHLAVIMADADARVVLQDILIGIRLNVSSIIAILGSDGQLLSSSQPLSDSVVQAIARRQPTIQDVTDTYIPNIKSISLAHWKVVILLSRSDIEAQLRWMYVAGGVFAIGGLCVTLLLFVVLSRWIVTPFQELMQAMKRVQDGNLQTRFVVKGEDEIAHLGHAFNAMVLQLNEMIEREYVMTLKQRNAEYRALQSQIQPHFLYNTLNGFLGLNRLGERGGLERAILALSGLLRYVLSSEQWVPIKEEFLFLQRYCDLQTLRFRDKMTCLVTYEAALADLALPKVLLQPLVENAIIHGIEPADHPCRVRVAATRMKAGDEERARVVIVIEDDGVGYAAETAKLGAGVGIANVRERLKLAYDDANLSIRSQPGSGTRVVMEIPQD